MWVTFVWTAQHRKSVAMSVYYKDNNFFHVNPNSIRYQQGSGWRCITYESRNSCIENTIYPSAFMQKLKSVCGWGGGCTLLKAVLESTFLSTETLPFIMISFVCIPPLVEHYCSCWWHQEFGTYIRAKNGLSANGYEFRTSIYAKEVWRYAKIIRLYVPVVIEMQGCIWCECMVYTYSSTNSWRNALIRIGQRSKQ